MIPKLHINTLLFLFFGIISIYTLHAQKNDYYLGATRYSFINYESNKIILPDDTREFDSLFAVINNINKGDQKQIRILHLGGSHIQADIYTHRIRMRMQQLAPDMRGARGMIFPFRMAKTNNPSNYKVSYTGNWEFSKSTKISDACPLGVTGMAVYTSDSIAKINIRLENSMEYYSDFDSVRIFHETLGYELRLLVGADSLSGSYDSIAGCTWFKLPSAASSFTLEIVQREKNSQFCLLGISLDNDGPGVVYDAIGVNGAKLSSYLNSELYKKHVQATKPDLVIVSIGTNDGYTRNFNKDRYYKEYRALINETLKAVPDAQFILTVPNDSYLYRRYVNRNTEEIRKIIFRIAKEENCGVWDFYTIMGGLNSAQAWYSLDLMKGDRIHFTRKGYEIKGELFFAAFLDEWEKRLNKEVQSVTANYE